MPLRNRRPMGSGKAHDGTGRSGNLVRSLVGGMMTAGGSSVVPDPKAVANVAAATPFTDSTFDAGTVNRFKPDPSKRFQNLMSGGAGTERASELNVQSQLAESGDIADRNFAEFEKNLDLQHQKALADILAGSTRQAQTEADTSIGENFRSFYNANPALEPPITVPAPMNAAAVGAMLRQAFGSNMQGGSVAGIPQALATGAVQNNTRLQAEAQKPFVSDISRAIEQIKLNTEKARMGGSFRPDFAKEVMQNQLETLRQPGTANFAGRTFSVSPGQTVVTPEATHQGPVFKTFSKPVMMTLSDGTQVPTGGTEREEQLAQDYRVTPRIPIQNPNPNPLGSQVQPFTPPPESPELYKIPTRRRRLGVGAGASGSY